MKTTRRKALALLGAATSSALHPMAASRAEVVPDPSERERVTGIGGVFFRARDPKALSQWYQDHLGIPAPPQSSTDSVWRQEEGQTLLTPFAVKTSYFGDPTKQWMINFRVRDLAKMTRQLEAAGIPVKVDPVAYPNGRFARIHDPEENIIELWQPAEAKAH